MNYYLIILRFIHIGGGVFWAGVAIYFAVFVLPASKKAGPAGGLFMQHLAQTNKLALVMTIVPTLVVLSGLLMIWEISHGLQSQWMASPHGIIIQTGATLAIIAYLTGFFFTRPALMKISAIGASLAGNPPSEEQARALGRQRAIMVKATNTIAVLLGFTVVMMSIVRQF